MDKSFVYVGDNESLAKIDPEKVKKVIFVGEYYKHPIYFSDDFLRFQMNVALAQKETIPSPAKNSSRRRFLGKLGARWS